MLDRKSARSLAAAGAVAASLAAVPALAQADVWGTQFESPAYSLGDIGGKGDWQKTGGYDANVVNVSNYANAAGYGFGSKALQISNFTTAGSFGDQTFTPSLVDEAGQAGADSGGMSGGVRQSRFLARWRIGVADPTNPGATDRHVTFSADRGDGARMSYLRFEDHSDGIHVFFDDVPSTAVDGSGNVNFVESEIAILSRAQSHLVETSIDFVDGESNDVVKVFIDGTLVKTGTTWENYYKHDAEQAPAGNKVPTVDSLLLREAGDANAGQQGKGFLVDDLRIETTSPGANQGPVGATGLQGGQGVSGPAGSSTAASQHLASPITLSTRSARANRRGIVAIKLSCPKAAGLCDGHLTLALGRRQVGSALFDLNGGKSQTLHVKLSRAALKALARKGQRLSVRALSRDSQGAAARTTGSIAVAKLTQG